VKRSKLDSLIFVEMEGDGRAQADALEKAVASAAPGDNLVYAAFVTNLSGRKEVAARAQNLAERGIISLTTIKVRTDPDRWVWHYIAQRSSRKYDRKGGGK
jgi:hypothetical protein